MTENHISAEQFWDYYFRNSFLTLKRENGQYTGQVPAKPAMGSSKWLLDDRQQISVLIDRVDLNRYDYIHDDRFALLLQRSTNPDRAFTSVIQKTYPYREAAPFGKQRMSELFSEIRPRWHQSSDTITLSGIEQIVTNIVEQYKDAHNQQLAALAWFLGEQRQRSSARALLAIVNNAAFVPFARHRIHFTPVDTAFSALWKVNNKSLTGDLLALMRTSSDTGRRKIAPLFERLVSTTELYSLEFCGEDYLNPDFWDPFFTSRRDFTDAKWDQYDMDSLFWEIRFLSASRLPVAETGFLDKLADDEVPIVSNTARKRLLK